MESCLNQYMVLWLSFCSHVRNFLLPTCVMRYFGVWKTAVSKRSEKERSRIQTSSRRWPGWRQLRHSGGWGPQCPGLTCSQEAERHTADELEPMRSRGGLQWEEERVQLTTAPQGGLPVMSPPRMTSPSTGSPPTSSFSGPTLAPFNPF